MTSQQSAGSASDLAGDDTKSARTRARILKAAAAVLRDRGFAGTRLSDIADVAEVQAPNLYYYFKSREELIEEVVTIGQRRVFEHVSEELAKQPDDGPIERIAVAVRAHLEVTLRESAFASAAIRNMGQLPEHIRGRLLAEQRKYGGVWRGLIDDAIESGDMNPDIDPSAARMLVLGALNWAPEWWNSRRGTLDSVIGAAQTIIVNGLRR